MASLYVYHYTNTTTDAANQHCYLLKAGLCARCFKNIIFTHYNNPKRQVKYDYSHFTDGGVEGQQAKVTSQKL